MKIGLALSGGGIRATVFHLGILARLARQSLLEEITFLSTVSGGSLSVALIRAFSGNSWFTSDYFLKRTILEARNLLTTCGLDRAYLRYLLFTTCGLRKGRSSALEKALNNCWSVKGLISDLPDKPRWIINSTCYETGKNWRIEKKRMGDYLAGYVTSPQLPISQAVAASSGVPGLVGSLKLDSRNFKWHAYDQNHSLQPHSSQFQTISLWDGAIYDNLGVEALFKPNLGYRDGMNFMIVSDASAALGIETRKISSPLRLVDIATDQVRSLRARTIITHFLENPGTGAYLKIGNTQEYIYQQAGCSTMRKQIRKGSLSTAEVKEAAQIGTTLRKLSLHEFELLFTHGYQVADATLSAYCRDTFGSIKFTSKLLHP